MLDWITGWVNRFLGIAGQGIVDLVHWGLHALASVIETIFVDVARAWRDLWGAMAAFEHATWEFGAQVFGLAVKVLKYWIPRLIHDLAAAALALWHGINWVWSHAVALINDLRKLAWKWINDLWHLVLRDVWAPLKAFADHLYHLILTWAYVAWWWITHLPSLAEAMIFHLAASLERHAWELARLLGGFLTALVLHNVRRVVQLAETILAAVL
jgi:hypothetical protein